MFKHVLSGIALVALIPAVQAETAGSDQDRMAALEQRVQTLADELELRDMAASDASNPLAGFRFGGYGEVHANFEEDGVSQFDLHRMVMFMGYDFSDWIILNTEVELEHAFATDGAGGEILAEQLYVDFLFSDAVNARVGRFLAPMGIINQNHEPTLFLGVERPSVEQYIIPSTWSIDGAGIYGAPCSGLNYQVYVVGGLDGSEFSADEGVRGGRIEERSGLNDPAVTGRIDLYPSEEQDLRVGVSGYFGGTDNANKGGGNGTDNNFSMAAADFEYLVSRFQFRGVVAMGHHSDPQNLPAGVGEEIFGWYLEGGMSVMPESWQSGKLADADIIPFVRYEEYDTQYKVPSGTVKDGANERTGITVGINFPLTQQFVLKGDYQFKSSEAASDPNNVFNLGMGWTF